MTLTVQSWRVELICVVVKIFTQVYGRMLAFTIHCKYNKMCWEGGGLVGKHLGEEAFFKRGGALG